MEYIDEEEETEIQDNILKNIYNIVKKKCNTINTFISINLLLLKDFFINLFRNLLTYIQILLLDIIIPFLIDFSTEFVIFFQTFSFN